MGTTQWVIGLVLILALAAAGWWITGRVERSYEADKLEYDLKISRDIQAMYLKRVKDAESSRAEAAQILIIKTDEYNARIKVLQKNVAKLAPKDRNCDLGPDRTGLLDDARGHGNN